MGYHHTYTITVLSTVSHFLDDNEVDPVERIHGQLHEALRRLDADTVGRILKDCPQAIKPRGGWQSAPLDVLADQRWRGKPEWLPCLELLLEAGADPNQGHAYRGSFMGRMIQDGCHEAITTISQAGKLNPQRDWLSDVCKAAWEGVSWKRGYRLLDTSRSLIQAGVEVVRPEHQNAGERIEGWAWTHLGSSTNRSIHPELLDTLALFIEQGASVSPTAVVRALRGGHDKAVAFLVQHCRSPADQVLAAIEADRMKPELRAKVERMLMEKNSAQAQTVVNESGRRLRL